MPEVRTPKKHKKLGSPDHAVWDRNKGYRLKVAMKDVQFSGNLGLAIKLKDPSADLTQLTPNSDVEFITLRYCPPGAFPMPDGKYMESHMASMGQANLAHGMPLISFEDARRTFNFRLRPDIRNGRTPLDPSGDVLHAAAFRREFGILNRIQSAMDHLAFCGVDAYGRPLRAPWNRHKPKGEDFQKDVRPQEPRSWMVNALVGVRARDMERLFDFATWKKTDQRTRYACPKCRQRHKAEDFQQKRFQTRWYDDGNFSAVCPRCHQRRKYFLDNVVKEQPKRSFKTAFKIAFCEWIAKGGPILALADADYDGPRKDKSRMTVHEFGSVELGDFTVHLDHRIVPEVETADTVKRGQVVAYALSHLPRWDELSKIWARKPLKDRWDSLAELFGSKYLVGWYQKQWFDNQAILVGEDLLAFPTRLMGAAAGKIEAQGLWWDLSPAQKYWDAELGAIVFPPIPLRRWNGFKINLPGQVRLDAGVKDPRFNTGPRSPRKHGRASFQESKAHATV